MKLDEVRQTYYSYSASASNISRQISFAGVAIIWIFRADEVDTFSLPQSLLLAATALLLSLTFDLLQYIYASAAWGIFHRLQEKKNGIDYSGEVYPSAYINWPSNLFFWGKLIFLIIGYLFLLIHGLNAIKSGY